MSHKTCASSVVSLAQEDRSILELPGRRPRILFIDAYDSFTNNIIALVDQSLNADIEVVHIDDPRFSDGSGVSFLSFLEGFDAAIAGPGPGNPQNESDVGLIAELWRLLEGSLLPVLGICLGFQSLCLAFGAKVERMNEPRHGIVTKIVHNSRSIFRDTEEVEATQYHSLHVDLGHLRQTRPSGTHDTDLWSPSKACPMLEPLAWDCDDRRNGYVLMAVKHIERPYWGVQYHPESICTNHEGAKIIDNWWNDAKAWTKRNKDDRRTIRDRQSSALQHVSGMESVFPNDMADLVNGLSSVDGPEHSEVSWRAVPANGLSAADVCEALDLPVDKLILLESGLRPDGQPVRTETGRYSIIGLVTENTTVFQYHTQSQRLDVVAPHRNNLERIHSISNIWDFLKCYMQQRRTTGGPSSSPFWGGLMGFVSYEAGLATIDVDPPSIKLSDLRPDICFVFITRSIVIDHVTHTAYIQTLNGQADQHWVEDMINTIPQIVKRGHLQPETSGSSNFVGPRREELPTEQREELNRKEVDLLLHQSNIMSPDQSKYCRKVKECQESIRAGDSYELCLTDQTVVKVPTSPPKLRFSWNVYQRLKRINPAPFGAYIRLGSSKNGVTIASSSHERFLSWSRDGTCQYRPIKGTVKKTPELTRADAETILHSSKERAENLMIVDLIRHDLHGVVGAGNVKVKKLMQVEEYETVYQLVSVIEGQLSGSHNLALDDLKTQEPCHARDAAPGKSGLDVLAASLPPGSMTGAPKRRSCEILRGIESNEPRGIYSGVLGYLDVGGGGDFSVVIRTAYKWDQDAEEIEQPDGSKKKFDVWRVGAGGAVTAQSTDVGEFEEMEAKRDSTLRMFTEFSKKS
ncbi:ADC synthase [Cryomyces antarcticus]